jgi:hypothetical protein
MLHAASHITKCRQAGEGAQSAISAHAHSAQAIEVSIMVGALAQRLLDKRGCPLANRGLCRTACGPATGEHTVSGTGYDSATSVVPVTGKGAVLSHKLQLNVGRICVDY